MPNEIKVERAKTGFNDYTGNKTRFNGTTTYNAEYSPKKIENTPLIKSVKYQQKSIPF